MRVTHKFNLPPATGNPDLIVFASGSSADTPVTSGPVTQVYSNVLTEVNSHFDQRNPTYNYDAGTKLTLPLQEFAGVRSSLLLGVDYKYFQSQIYSTNVSNFDYYTIDSFGNRVFSRSEVIALADNSQQQLFYIPLSLGWVASRPDKWGTFSFNYGQNFFFAPLGSARTNFQSVASSSKAGGNYTTINAGLVRIQNLPGNWSAMLNANGQWASEPLISNEQLPLGGTSGVRGYEEGEAYGDTGWRTLFDLRAPPLNVGYFATSKGDVPASLRVSWFMDYGRVYLLDRPSPYTHHLSEWGTGIGFYLTAGEHFDARLTLGWALQAGSSSSNPTQTAVTTSAGECQAYFSVGCQFLKVFMRLKHPFWSGAKKPFWLSALLLALCNGHLSANPTGMTVLSGSGIAQQIGSHLNVTVSQTAILNWSSFNIKAGETTTFLQPSINSVVFNEIGGANPSKIFGSLNANGTVILANVHGFYFGPDSMISVGGSFIATTAPITPDFGAGSAWQFTGMPPLASIVNYGQIKVGADKSLYLIAEQIENHGGLAAPAVMSGSTPAKMCW